MSGDEIVDCRQESGLRLLPVALLQEGDELFHRRLLLGRELRNKLSQILRFHAPPGHQEYTPAFGPQQRGQKAEGGSQKSEGRSQKAEVRRQKSEGRSQKAEEKVLGAGEW